MIRKILWFIAGSIVVSIGVILFLRPELFQTLFIWLLRHPLTPLSGALALWAIIVLLGEKNLKKAMWIECMAIPLLFHVEFMRLFNSILYSFVNFWRSL